MVHNFLLLQYLLYINPTIGLNIDGAGLSTLFAISGTKVPFFNKVCNSSTPKDQEVIDIASFFKNTPYVWVVDASDKATINMLQKNGMVYRASAPAMILDLSTIDSVQIDKDIVIQEIKVDDSEIKQWLSCIALLKNKNVSDLILFFNALKNKSQNFIKLYQGLYKGVAVSTCMIIQHDKDTVSVNWVSTLPQFQGKGLGFAITHKALLDAKKQGYSKAILLTTEQGISLYKRLGFEEYAVYDYYSNGSFYLLYRTIVQKVWEFLWLSPKSSLILYTNKF